MLAHLKTTENTCLELWKQKWPSITSLSTIAATLLSTGTQRQRHSTLVLKISLFATDQRRCFWISVHHRSHEKVQFCPQNFIIGQKSFCWYGIAIFVKRAYHQYTRGFSEKKISPRKCSIFEVEVIFWGTSLILVTSGHSILAVDAFFWDKTYACANFYVFEWLCYKPNHDFNFHIQY